MEAYQKFQEYLVRELESIRSAGLYKEERIIVSPQSEKLNWNPERKFSISVQIII